MLSCLNRCKLLCTTRGTHKSRASKNTNTTTQLQLQHKQQSTTMQWSGWSLQHYFITS